MDVTTISVFFVLIVVIIIIIINNRKKSTKKINEKQEWNNKCIDFMKKTDFNFDKIIEDEIFIFAADEKNKKCCVFTRNMNAPMAFNYLDIIEYEIYENGSSVMKGSAGSAIIGGLVFGVVGAVVGASRSKIINEMCDTLQVRISINNLQTPEAIIDINQYKVSKGSEDYKNYVDKAKEIIATLNYITKQGA